MSKPDGGLQQERTALSWERTAISTMAVGLLFARYAAQEDLIIFSAVGIIQTLLGGVLLVWASHHYVDLHGSLAADRDILHPKATRLVGLATVGFTTLALLLAVVLLAAGT